MPETVTLDTEALRMRLNEVRQRIEMGARRVGRAPEEITLIAVSKTHPTHVLDRAIMAGARDLGENRVQEAQGKIEALGRERARWHLIGHLQANKARRAVKIFDMVHSVDTVALVERLERLCAEEEREELQILIQVDLAGEVTKTGATEDELPALVDALSRCEHLRLMGLMTLPPFFEDADRARPYFQRLRELRDALRARAAFSTGDGELSMGMSHDYEMAIEEGATMVRVGTAIFGARAAAV